MEHAAGSLRAAADDDAAQTRTIAASDAAAAAASSAAPNPRITFGETSVGVAASGGASAMTRYSRALKQKLSGGGSGPSSSTAPTAPIVPPPPPGARSFNSAAMPARPALKNSNSQSNLVGHDEPAPAPAPAAPRPSAGGAAFLAALGGAPAAAPIFGRSPPPQQAAVVHNPVFEGTGTPDAVAVAVAGAGFNGGVDPRKHVSALAAGAGGGEVVPYDDDVLAAGDDQMLAGGSAGMGGFGGGDPRDDAASGSAVVPPGASRPLPRLRAQLTLRALTVGVAVGCGFSFLVARLLLVAGLAPSLQVVMAAGCWLILQAYARAVGRDVACVPPLEPQEAAVASAAALAAAGTAVAAAFGPALSAMTASAHAAASANGGAAGDARDAVALDYGGAVAWTALVAVAGGLMIVPFRRALLSSPALTFPTGASTGLLINTLSTPRDSYIGRKQAVRFVQYSIISFVVSGYEWVFNNPACDGFAKFPTFGLSLARWRWLYDGSLPLVGVGLMAPLGVAWSALLGALAAWGFLWPLLDARAGDWYARGLPQGDARGLYGYQLALGLGLVLGDACVALVRGAVTGMAQVVRAVRKQPPPPPQHGNAAYAAYASRAPVGMPPPPPPLQQQPLQQDSELPRRDRKGKAAARARRRWHAEAIAALEADALSDASNLQWSMAALERSLRRHVFMSDEMRGASPSCIVAAAVLLIAAAFALPPLLEPLRGLNWWRLIAASALAPLAAVSNARVAGAIDANLAPAIAAAGAAAFSAWGGAGGGVPGGLVASALLLGAAQAAVQLCASFAAGYASLTSPTAILVGHAVGTVAGALFAPLAFALLAPSLPLSPLAAPARALAGAFAAGGAKAFPRYSGWFGLIAFVAGLAFAGARSALPPTRPRLRGLLPSPATCGAVFILGANYAVGIMLGTLVRVAWRWRSPRGADAFAGLVGGALIAGDGLWALGRALLGAFGVRAPICVTFAPAPAA